MTAGLSDDLQQIDATCKTAIINAELHQLDIAPLQETRLADNGSLTKMHYTFCVFVDVHFILKIIPKKEV